LRLDVWLAAAVCVTAQLANAQNKILPVDQAAKDPSFLAYRQKLIDAVKQKDTKALLSMLDPEISISFGGDSGLASFRKNWKLDQAPENSPLWQELGTVLAMGGAWMPDSKGKLTTFCAPYTYTQMPEDDNDTFAVAAIIGKDVALRSAPRDNGGVIRRLSYDRVHLVGGEGEYRWRKIQTLDKIQGYVLRTEVRSGIDTRACFDKKAGIWKMTTLVAGD